MEVGNINNNYPAINIQNNIHKNAIKPLNTLTSPKEAIYLNSTNKSFNESLIRKYYRTDFIHGYNTMEGSINDKSVYLKIDNQRTSFTSFDNTFSGNMGDKNVELKESMSTLSKIRNITGKVGDKEVNLNYDFGLGIFRKASITGTIDGKEINIYPGAPVENAADENDILTLIASLEGNSFSIKNGTFNKFNLSQQGKLDYDQQMMEAAMAQQMGYI